MFWLIGFFLLVFFLLINLNAYLWKFVGQDKWPKKKPNICVIQPTIGWFSWSGEINERINRSAAVLSWAERKAKSTTMNILFDHGVVGDQILHLFITTSYEHINCKNYMHLWPRFVCRNRSFVDSKTGNFLMDKMIAVIPMDNVGCNMCLQTTPQFLMLNKTKSLAADPIVPLALSKLPQLIPLSCYAAIRNIISCSQ